MSYNSDYEVRLATLGAMGGDVTKNYNSVYEIDLEILKLMEQGGGNASAIESVDVLPDASENKNKLYRLSSDDNVYVSELKSRTTITTNKLPDAQQIDKAYLYDGGETNPHYKGSYTITCADGVLNWFLWKTDDGIKWLTADNAVNTNADTHMVPGEDDEDYGLYWSNITENSATVNWTMQHIDEFSSVGTEGFTSVSATYNAPESSQIGNAYIKEGANAYTGIYDGTQVTFIDTDGTGEEVTGFKWTIEGNDEYYIATSKPASEIYFGESLIEEGVWGYYYDVKVWDVLVDGSESEGSTISQEFEDSLYIPQLNAPDSEQVDNAYITKDDGDDVTTYNYTDVIKTIIVSDGSLYVYIWGEYSDELWMQDCKGTTVPANEIYSNNQIIEIGGLDDYEWSISGDTITNLEISLTDLEENNISSLIDNNDSVSTVKYQRTETIEVWDWEKVATEQYVNDAIDEIPQLEAGQNIEIVDNKINVLGYSFNGRSFNEIPLVRTDAIQEFPYPLEQLGLNDLQLTGDAGVTTYTMGGTSAVVMAQMGTQLIQMSVMMKTANSEIAKITSINTTNSTITFESTLDANNALSNAVVTNLYIPLVIIISGDAGATTYTYTSQMPLPFEISDTVSFGDYPLVKVIGIDSSNHTVTFDNTLDENNAVSNAQFNYSLSENNTASGNCSHAEGGNTTASGNCSHAEGGNTTASGNYSHAEGGNTTASGEDSHAEGNSTNASGVTSHAEGSSTIAQNYCEHAEGRYNTSHKASEIYGNSGNTQHSVGIGTGSTSQHRKNAVEVMQNGDMYVFGVGGYQGTNTKVQDVSIKTLQEYIASLDSRLTALGG